MGDNQVLGEPEPESDRACHFVATYAAVAGEVKDAMVIAGSEFEQRPTHGHDIHRGADFLRRHAHRAPVLEGGNHARQRRVARAQRRQTDHQ